MFGLGQKWVFYLLEGLNAFACSYYFNYLFFYLRDVFGFGNKENLAICAFHGLIYAIGSWQGGKFVAKVGQIRALKIGFIGMAISLAAGIYLAAYLPFIFLILIGWTISMCLIWPSIESLVSDNEPADKVPSMVGIYNVVWAAGSAISYFVGGAIYEHLGRLSLFWFPPLIHIVQLLVLSGTINKPVHSDTSVSPVNTEKQSSTQPSKNVVDKNVAEKFLRMAWIANPFAYVAMNTILAVIPGLAKTHGLNPTETGLFCSIWFFARLVAFVILWQWTGWHYKFRWMLSSYAMLIGGFMTILIAQKLWIICLAQVAFGWAIGLFYYSSLYYAMDVGEAGAEHGGLHEAAIGIGILVGPAIGSISLYTVPDKPHIFTYAIAILLTCSLIWLIVVYLKSTGKNVANRTQKLS